MALNKPFHRNYRKMKDGHNSGYSNWAYTVDHKYANHPEHYTRAFIIIQQDIVNLFEFIEPCDNNNSTYSFRIHELLMRTCMEVEANFKAIFRENIYTPFTRKGKPRLEKDWTIHDYKKINKTHRLQDYEVEFPFWKGSDNIRRPFLEWSTGDNLSWYQAYNQSKHDRLQHFHLANFKNLLLAYSALFTLLSSQFYRSDFLPGNEGLILETGSYYKKDFGVGGFLMIEFPNTWTEDEMHEFNWNDLERDPDRFIKFDYNAI